MTIEATKSTSVTHSTVNPSATSEEVTMIHSANALPPVPASIAATPIVATSAAGTPAQASATTMTLSPPPDISTIPSPPDDYVAPTPGEFRVVAPRKSELAALPQAVTDAKNFTQYTQLIGGNGPTLDQIIQSFDLARQ